MSLPLTVWISGAFSRSRECTQFLGRAPATGAAHDDYTVGLIDAPNNIRNVRRASRKLRLRPQRRDASDATVGLRRDDILRKRQVRDAAARISRRNRLMDDGRRLTGR